MNKLLPFMRIYMLLGAFVMLSCKSNSQNNSFVKDNYTKYEYEIPMRDGIKLYTVVYVPKDASSKNKYPILMTRTCYSCAPYGAGKFPSVDRLGPSKFLVQDKFIFCASGRARTLDVGGKV